MDDINAAINIQPASFSAAAATELPDFCRTIALATSKIAEGSLHNTQNFILPSFIATKQKKEQESRQTINLIW